MKFHRHGDDLPAGRPSGDNSQLGPACGQLGLDAISCLFVHAHRGHLLSNTLVLLAAGPAVEGREGPVVLLAMFLGCGAVANLVAAAGLPDGSLLIGASGGFRHCWAAGRSPGAGVGYFLAYS